MPSIRQPENIVVVVLDTLRKDYAKPIENLLKEYGFISFSNAIAPSPWTIPSHASIFTGLYPRHHGAHETKTLKIHDVKMRRENKLVKLVKEYGYKTYLISANPFISSSFGFRGFDSETLIDYISERKPMISKDDIEKWRRYRSKYNSRPRTILHVLLEAQLPLLFRVGLEKLNDIFFHLNLALVKRWPLYKGSKDILLLVNRIMRNTDHRRFIFINLMEAHEPYTRDLSREIRETIRSKIMGNADKRIIRVWREQYNKEVKVLRKTIKALLDILQRRGDIGKSLIVVSSDHGQLLGEKGRLGHGTFLDDELLRVPLLVHYNKEFINTIECSNGFVSLKQVYTIIAKALGEYGKEVSLCNTTVFAESYGVDYSPDTIREMLADLNIPEDEIIRNYQYLNMYRIAMYDHNLGIKAIYNVEKNTVEHIECLNKHCEKAMENDIGEIKKKVQRFVKLGIRRAFKI